MSKIVIWGTGSRKSQFLRCLAMLVNALLVGLIEEVGPLDLNL